VITVEDWALIRRLHKGEGLSQREIAKRLGIARDTVANAIKSESPPKYSRPDRPSELRELEPQIRQWLKDHPRMPATVIAERVGWQGSTSWFREVVARLRPEFAPADPADRISYVPGDQAQCDLWFPPVKIPLGHGQASSPPVLVIVASHSRFITAVMLPSRTTPDLLAGIWQLISVQLGAVPRRLVWDNEAGIGRRGTLAEGVAAFAGTLAARVVQLKPFDPESKGIVERANQYLETSFLPGRAFESPADFNQQLNTWLGRANTRSVKRIGARPAELIATDRAAMLPLPPIAPTFGFTTRVRLPRDYYVSVLGNDYSVDPTAIGRMIEVRADLDTVTATLDGAVLARHERVWARGQTVTDDNHVLVAARLRTAFQTPTPALQERFDRNLADYDHVFGVTLDSSEVA
jgi:transposase